MPRFLVVPLCLLCTYHSVDSSTGEKVEQLASGQSREPEKTKEDRGQSIVDCEWIESTKLGVEGEESSLFQSLLLELLLPRQG